MFNFDKFLLEKWTIGLDSLSNFLLIRVIFYRIDLLIYQIHDEKIVYTMFLNIEVLSLVTAVLIQYRSNVSFFIRFLLK